VTFAQQAGPGGRLDHSSSAQRHNIFRANTPDSGLVKRAMTEWASSGADVALEASEQNAVAVDLSGAVANVAKTVDIALDTLLPTPEGAEARLAEAMRYATFNGGKRLRAFLVMETASLFAVAETCAARTAAAVEMIHAYSLVHDDLPGMDNDDLRRGKPTVHKAFDEATAILVGDALQTRAFEVLAEHDTHSDPQARCELVQALASAAGARGMAGGQMIDMLAEGRQLDAPSITRLQALKTGRLIQFSAEAGAILGRAPSPQRHMLAAYGRDLGAAYQIADDLLDAEGSTEETGKTAGKDAAAGKATMVAILGPERARAHATMLAQQAAHHLDSFGAKAALLQALATFAVTRRS
jgi:farnesyl diphosphate synthase